MKLPRRKFLQLAVGVAALPVILRTAVAQNYPTRPIRLVVPFPPGGAFDAVGRPLADKMKPLLGTVVIENIGGAGSSLGAAAVARAQSDGYTILLGGTQTHVNEALLKSRPLYDPIKDLDPIASVAAYFLGIAVHPTVPVQTLSDLVAYAKANPGKLSYGHAGIGTIQHLTGELFKSLTKTPEIVQVPYRGTGPAIADLVGGQIPMGIVGVTGQVLELHRSDKMRVLAVTGPTLSYRCSQSSNDGRIGLPGNDRERVDWIAGTGRDASQHYRTDCASNASGSGRTGIQADVDRSGYASHSRLKPRKIPTVAGNRCRSLDAARQSARFENRLTTRAVFPDRNKSTPSGDCLPWVRSGHRPVSGLRLLCSRLRTYRPRASGPLWPGTDFDGFRHSAASLTFGPIDNRLVSIHP